MLSKSDFQIASTCSKKLVYKKASFETMNDANEYMEMLAQGGYIVSKYAQLTFPGAVEVKGESIDAVIAETKKLIQENENVTLLEATFSSNGKIVRTDIIEKKKNVLNI